MDKGKLIDSSELILAAIRLDIKKGLIPYTVSSFSELHDYVDANEYLTLIFPDWSIANLDESNEILNLVDCCIKTGALN